MPVRIYALAKDLKVDSKDLADICKKIGLPGKGSALASLDDDEVQRVKDYLDSIAQKKSSAAAAASENKPAAVAPPARKPVSIVPTRSSKTESTARASTPIGTRRPATATSPLLQQEPEEIAGGSPPGFTGEPSGPAAVGEATLPFSEIPAERATPPGESEGSSPASTTADRRSSPHVGKPSGTAGGAGDGGGGAGGTKFSPAAQAPTSPTRAPVRGGIFGGAGGGKIRVLGRGTEGRGVEGRGKDGEDGRERDRDGAGLRGGGKRRGPVINLAAMPEAKQPSAKPSSTEPPAQKPEIRLSKDVIAGHKQGMKASLEALQAQEQEKENEKKKTATAKGGLSSFTAGDKARGRGGKVAPKVDEEEDRRGLAGMATARAQRGAKGRRRSSQRQDIETSLLKDEGRRRRTLTRRGTNTAAPRKEKVALELPCTLRQFSEAAGVPVAQVLRVLMGMGMMLNINASINQETAEMVAAEMDLDIELKAEETLEDEVISEIEADEDGEETLVNRPPIVTFLGHVDHGKTSLLDALIGTSVVKGEAGGITQHIRAYQVDKEGRKVTFVDTPGHEAFTEMRARGANVTDIAVLVIAADDGIMPQTEEAISHAKAAGVPIVVALNKIDLAGTDPNRVMTQLTEHGLTPSEWGGDVEVVRTSATTGQGLDELLETLLTVAELHEYRANPDRAAIGVCIEAGQEGDRGVIAKIVVTSGTLRPGDILLCGGSYGRVRAMFDPLTKKSVREAGPSTPVAVIGLDSPPGAGDKFYVLDDIAQAREIAAKREESSRNQVLSGITTKVSFENFQAMVQEGRLGPDKDIVRLNVIIRADARGSLEAIDKELSKIDHPEVEIRVLQRAVGGITVADVTLASASDAVILGFNAIPDEAARSLADQRGVEIRRYDVIYKLTDEIKAILEGRLKPEERVVELGRALVKQVFQISRSGTIAGSYVAQGVIERGCRIRVCRDGRTIGDYALDSVRRVKEDVKEVPRGMECGIKLAGFNDLRQDDVLEAYKIEEVARTLD